MMLLKTTMNFINLSFKSTNLIHFPSRKYAGVENRGVISTSQKLTPRKKIINQK